jgi:hypothetical protein
LFKNVFNQVRTVYWTVQAEKRLNIQSNWWVVMFLAYVNLENEIGSKGQATQAYGVFGHVVYAREDTSEVCGASKLVTATLWLNFA